MPSKENKNLFGRSRSGGLSGGVDKIKERLGRNPTPANNNNNSNNSSGRRPLPSPSPPPPPPLTNRQREQLLQKSGNSNNKIPPTGESSARQFSQDKQQKQLTNNTNNNNKNNTEVEVDTMTLQKLSSIQNVYGSNANIYTDVLKVKQNATSSEIREAFFCLRYDVYQKLEGTTNDNTANALTSDKRKEVEEKMDAITSAYHILSDVNRRKVYDASLLQQQKSVEMDVDKEENENEYDDNGIISSTRGGMNSNRKSSSSSKKISSPESNHLPIGQRRSVLRRNRAASGRASGMNVGRQVRAETVGGALNTRAAPSAETQDSSVFGSNEVTPQGNTTGRVSPWDADFSNANLPAAHQVNTSLDTQAAALGVGKPMTAREEMLYRSKLHFDSQKNKLNTNNDGGGGERLPPKGRIGSVRYGNKAGPGQLVSPTGVEGFDSSGNNKLRRPSPTTTTESQSIVSKDEDDDTRASSMYDDDVTYDTETYADDTTYGETIDDTTIGDSTWASYDDESYVTNDHESEGGKFSPGHKKGTKPEPILKSGLNKNGSKVKRSNSDSRRVTIHSHRGKGEKNDEDFSLFEGACPNMPTVPSLQGITEEAIGTYHDFTHALHQVSTSFVLSPDDIDKMADKIRDAKIELGENYHRQVKERNQLIDNGGRERSSSKSQGKSRSNERSSSKRQVKKTLSA